MVLIKMNKKFNPSPYGKGTENFSSKPVSRVLYSLAGASIINLVRPLLTGSINLPIPTLTLAHYTEASSLTFGTYLVFQLLGFTAIHVTMQSRELLPHVFTFTRCGGLTPTNSWKYILCGTCRRPLLGAFLLGSRMLCVARTFLRP